MINKIFPMLVAAMLFALGAAWACEITVTNDGEAKEFYSIGDQVILKVTVVLTHRNCREGIDATKFQPEGLVILGATPWKETNRNTYERLIKAEIDSAAENEAILHARRTCNKEGGYGAIKLLIK